VYTAHCCHISYITLLLTEVPWRMANESSFRVMVLFSARLNFRQLKTMPPCSNIMGSEYQTCLWGQQSVWELLCCTTLLDNIVISRLSLLCKHTTFTFSTLFLCCINTYISHTFLYDFTITFSGLFYLYCTISFLLCILSKFFKRIWMNCCNNMYFNL